MIFQLVKEFSPLIKSSVNCSTFDARLFGRREVNLLKIAKAFCVFTAIAVKRRNTIANGKVKSATKIDPFILVISANLEKISSNGTNTEDPMRIAIRAKPSMIRSINIVLRAVAVETSSLFLR